MSRVSTNWLYIHLRIHLRPSVILNTSNKRIFEKRLAVVIAPVPFLFKSYDTKVILHNFDFNWCSVLTECFFRLENSSNCQNHSSLGSHHPVKKSPPPPKQNFWLPSPHWGDLPPPLFIIWETLFRALGIKQKLVWRLLIIVVVLVIESTNITIS